VDETVVAGVTESRGQKNDTRDAYGLAEKLRTGALEKRIFKAPREIQRAPGALAPEWDHAREKPTFRWDLGGRLKSGHTWTSDNRP